MTPSTPHVAAAGERLWLALGWTLVLGPVVAHGIWRPLLVALGATGDAGWISIAALVVAVAAGLGRWRWPSRAILGWACAGATALVSAVLVGGSGRGIIAALVALLAVASSASAVLPIMLARVPAELHGIARGRRVATALVVLLMSVTVVQSARLSTFMGDSTRTETAASGLVPQLTHHACSTAYVQAAKLATARVDNLYDADWWPELGHTDNGRAQAQAYAPFDLDTFAYPPQFLLLPRLLLVFGDDFAMQRALWFGLNGLWLALGLWVVATWIGEVDGRAGARVLLLAPLVWGGVTSLVTLQVGNVHLSVMVAAVVGMIAFERGRPVLGGTLLAFAILAKISPGLLGIVLLMRRRWRDALWTAGASLAWTLLALLVFGLAPFTAFVRYELPRLSSGEALEFFTKSVFDIATNTAPFGAPFKLQALGLPLTDVWATASTTGTIYTLVAVALTLIAARRAGDRRIQAGLWLAVLTLGALRSPFAPGYVGFTAIWLLSLWAAEVHRARGVVLLVVGFLLVGGTPPMPDAPMLIVSLVAQTVLLGLVAWFIVRRER